MLLKMYLRWTERRGFKREMIDQQPGDEAGIKSATRDRHRRVRLRPAHRPKPACIGSCASRPSIRRRGGTRRSRRSTSGPSCPTTSTSTIDDKDLRIDTYRSSGAGGQHVNVTDSASASRTSRPASSCRARTSDRSTRTATSAMKVLKARLYDLQAEGAAGALEQLGGEKKDIAFGSQIRSYVLQPYQMVKDHRTKVEVGDVEPRPRRRPRRLHQGLPDGEVVGNARSGHRRERGVIRILLLVSARHAVPLPVRAPYRMTSSKRCAKPVRPAPSCPRSDVIPRR